MKQKVLIVDDSEPIHQLLKVHLAEEPYEVDSVYDGASALAVAASTPPDLILLDVDMPDMNGFDVCRRLKSDPKTAAIVVIFVTAARSTSEKVRGLEMNALDYVTKPFEPDELRARIRAALIIKRLLDLAPHPQEGAEEGESEPAAREPNLSNRKPTYQQVMLARSRNPWNRIGPAQRCSAAKID